MGRAAKSSAATWVEIQGYLDQSLGLGRELKTPGHHEHVPVPYYLWPLSTVSLLAKAARSIFKVQRATWMPMLFHEMEFVSINFLKRSQKCL